MLLTQLQLTDSAPYHLPHWLTQDGIDCSGIAIINKNEHERYLVATRQIKPGENLLTLPLSHVMSASLARQSDIGEKMARAGLTGQGEHSFLAVYLLQQNCQESSFWTPYLDILPEDFNHIPLFYSPETLSQLQSSPMIEIVLARRFTLEQEYNQLMQLSEMEQYSLDQYMWARTVIDSRCFILNGEVVLAPLLDMANHVSEPNTLWHQSEEKNALHLVSQSNIAAGEEVTVSYGRKSNRRLFACYGFVRDDKGFNSARITLSLDLSDPLIAEKMALMEIENYAQDIDIGPFEQDGFLKALMFLRISSSKCLLPNLACYQKPGGKLDEILVLQEFLQSCQQMLVLYDNNPMLKSQSSAQAQNLANCKKFLAQEKHTLKRYALFALTALTFLTHGNSVDYIEQEIEEDYQADLLALVEETATEEDIT